MPKFSDLSDKRTEDDLDKVDFSMPIILFSQTTKSVEGFNSLVNSIQNKIAPSTEFKYHDTICRQVANRIPNIQKFAKRFDVILFVSGAKSSNGKVLFEQCRSVNERAYLVSELTDIREEWFAGAESIGICGATSTPKWLMNNVFTYVKNLII